MGLLVSSLFAAFDLIVRKGIFPLFQNLLLWVFYAAGLYTSDLSQ